MSKCLDKLPHSCGTRAGLQVFADDSGGVNGYCFSCRTYVKHPYGEPKKVEDLPEGTVKSQAEIDAEIAEISTFPSVTLGEKKLHEDQMKYFGVKVALSEQDGKTPTMICYPYRKDGVLKGYKFKTLEEKRIWSVGDLKGCDFFGWDEALRMGARKIIITEGEDDCMSLTRVINRFSREGYSDYTAVVSLPSGVHSAASFIASKMKDLKSNFSEVIISFDMDEPGQQAVKDVLLSCPGVKVMDCPSKDANQSVIDGKQKALYNATFKAYIPKTSRLVFGRDVRELAKQPPKWGELSWPWEHINNATRGIRLGETIYIGAGVKMGKSEILNAMGAHFIQHNGVKVFMAKPEESNTHTHKLMCGKLAGRIFHDPKVEFDEEAYDKAADLIDDNLMMVDLYQHIGWDSLKEDIVAACNHGAKAVFIDPITNLTAGIGSGEANTELERVATEIAAMAKDMEFAAFLFCHLRAHEGNIGKERRDKYYRDNRFIGLGNCPHELGGDVQSMQFAGSRAMMRSCHCMIGIEGNKDPELANAVSNIRNLKILEERTFGAKGIFPIAWNENTSLFKELSF